MRKRDEPRAAVRRHWSETREQGIHALPTALLCRLGNVTLIRRYQREIFNP